MRHFFLRTSTPPLNPWLSVSGLAAFSAACLPARFFASWPNRPPFSWACAAAGRTASLVSEVVQPLAVALRLTLTQASQREEEERAFVQIWERRRREQKVRLFASSLLPSFFSWLILKFVIEDGGSGKFLKGFFFSRKFCAFSLA